MLDLFINRPLPKTELGKMILIATDDFLLNYYEESKRNEVISILRRKRLTELYRVLRRHNRGQFDYLIKMYHLKDELSYEVKGLLGLINYDDLIL